MGLNRFGADGCGFAKARLAGRCSTNSHLLFNTKRVCDFSQTLLEFFTLTVERLFRFDDCCHIDGVITKVGRDLIDQVGWSIFFQDRDAGQHFPLVYHLLCYIESS